MESSSLVLERWLLQREVVRELLGIPGNQERLANMEVSY